jgi:hypothetical protein
MFNSASSRREVSKLLSMNIELSKMNKKTAIIPIKDKRLNTGAKQSIAKGVYDPIELKSSSKNRSKMESNENLWTNSDWKKKQLKKVKPRLNDFLMDDIIST